MKPFTHPSACWPMKHRSTPKMPRPIISIKTRKLFFFLRQQAHRAAVLRDVALKPGLVELVLQLRRETRPQRTPRVHAGSLVQGEAVTLRVRGPRRGRGQRRDPRYRQLRDRRGLPGRPVRVAAVGTVRVRRPRRRSQIVAVAKFSVKSFRLIVTPKEDDHMDPRDEQEAPQSRARARGPGVAAAAAIERRCPLVARR